MSQNNWSLSKWLSAGIQLYGRRVHTRNIRNKLCRKVW
ncbi:hypothetical protein MAR_023003 [Mya arenaria]|uniref:Ribosomal protein L20 n=1 Tax=Mya arenaria TaxID=6604 RepID=A0ABY7DUM8_MYAAR|nr:hypothetical protein MAR_023003 [Mya arenaria]